MPFRRAAKALGGFSLVNKVCVAEEEFCLQMAEVSLKQTDANWDPFAV